MTKSRCSICLNLELVLNHLAPAISPVTPVAPSTIKTKVPPTQYPLYAKANSPKKNDFILRGGRPPGDQVGLPPRSRMSELVIAHWEYKLS